MSDPDPSLRLRDALTVTRGERRGASTRWSQDLRRASLVIIAISRFRERTETFDMAQPREIITALKGVRGVNKRYLGAL